MFIDEPKEKSTVGNALGPDWSLQVNMKGKIKVLISYLNLQHILSGCE